MSYTNLKYHVVFSTKGRQQLLTDVVVERLCDYVGGILRDKKCRLLAANAVPDHMHLAVLVPPTIAVAEIVRIIKANSSKWISETWSDMGSFAWQEGYSCFSVSESVIGKIVEYIRMQKEHHKKMSFQEKLVALLKRNNVDYDDR